MKNRYLILCLCLYVIVLSGIVGCAPWVDQLDRDDPKNAKFFAEDTIYKKDFNVNKFGTEYVDGLYKPAKAGPPRLKVPKKRPEGPNVPGVEGEVEMAFIHLSDVQIRDERVKLFGKNASRTLDHIIPSFEHGRDQEHYDFAAYLAIIKTINAYVDSQSDERSVKRPKFMIHTGDAVDAGVIEELHEFLYISNQLRMPWFNVLGNHDVTVFGNFNNKKVYVNDPNLTFQTLHNKYNYINMHGGGAAVDPNINVGPPEANQPIQMDRTGSRYHGFDLYKRERNMQYAVNNIYPCRECPGYYSFTLWKVDGVYGFDPPGENGSHKEPQEIVCVVLDTTTTQLGFAKGKVDEEQLDWLGGQLEGNKGKLVLVFGHHPLNSANFLDDSYETLIKLFHRYNVVAYFCGHTHAHKINFHGRNGTDQGFWEVIADSILEFPQEGSLVTIRGLGGGIGAIDVQSLSKNIENDCNCAGKECECETANTGGVDGPAGKKINNCGCLLDKWSELAFEDARENHPREIDDLDRNARLTFYHDYFKDN